MRVIDAIIQAMKNLGGEASLAELYDEVNKYRPTPEHSIRGRLYEHSSDCDIYKKTSEDIFQSSEGKGKGLWRFRDKSESSLNTWKDEVFYEEKFSIGESFRTKEDIRKKSYLHPMKDGSRESWAGYASLANAVLLFVNLYKGDVNKIYQFNDYFDGSDFFWESQNGNTLDTPYIQKILAETNIFLFCRINKKDNWTYVGKLAALNFETSTDPIKFQFEALDYQDNASGDLKDIYDWKPNNQTVVPRLSMNHKKVRRTSQGYISDTKKKNAIELHAMEQASKFYSDQKFEVIDVSDTRGLGYDYRCVKDETILEVEVKGTSLSGKELNLTRNEVINAQTTNNVPVLFIVFDILLVIDGKDYKVINSKQKVINNWKPQEKNLEALTYKYRLES